MLGALIAKVSIIGNAALINNGRIKGANNISKAFKNLLRHFEDCINIRDVIKAN